MERERDVAETARSSISILILNPIPDTCSAWPHFPEGFDRRL